MEVGIERIKKDYEQNLSSIRKDLEYLKIQISDKVGKEISIALENVLKSKNIEELKQNYISPFKIMEDGVLDYLYTLPNIPVEIEFGFNFKHYLELNDINRLRENIKENKRNINLNTILE